MPSAPGLFYPSPMRRMIRGREKTRENQFVRPNTVPVASTLLMNFSLPPSTGALANLRFKNHRGFSANPRLDG